MRVRHLPPPQAPTAAKEGALPCAAQAVAEALAASARSGACLDVSGVRGHLAALGGLGRPGLWAVVRLLAQLHALRETPAGGAAADAFEAHCQLAAIDALARAANDAPHMLADAYRAATCSTVRDSLCEAAGRVAGKDPACFALMVEHLQHNSFVAALSLAGYGDAEALPHLQAQLTREIRHAPEGEQQASLRPLRVDALLEAIGELGGRLPAEMMGQLASVVARGRPALGPLLALLPPEAPFRSI